MSTLQTYGRKNPNRTPQTTNENYWDSFGTAPYQFAAINVEPPPVEVKETVASKKTKKEFGAQSQQSSTAFSQYTGKLKSKKKNANDIRNGHSDDIDFLLREIDTCQAGLSVHCIRKLIVLAPHAENSEERLRCTDWLTKIGFESTVFGTYNYPMNDVPALERALKATRPTLNHSVSSEFFAAESTSSKSDDFDRSSRASEKLRARSVSNPPVLVTTNLVENTPAPHSWSRTRSNSTFSNPGGLFINVRNRRNTGDSNDSSDYLESPACHPDNFSPMNCTSSAKRIGGRPGSSCSLRAPSPWQQDLGDQLLNTKISGPEDEEAASDRGAPSVGFPLSAKHALHCIQEEDHDHHNDLTMDEDAIKADLQKQQQQSQVPSPLTDSALVSTVASIAAPAVTASAAEETEEEGEEEGLAADHDSDTSTVIDEEEDVPADEIVSPEVSVNHSGLHVSSHSMDHSPGHMHMLMGHHPSSGGSQNHSFSSPTSSGGRVVEGPVVVPIALMSHASPPTGGFSSSTHSTSHGVTFYQGHLPPVTRAVSLFGDSSSTSHYGGTASSSALNGTSPDMQAFRTQRPLGGAGVGGGGVGGPLNSRNARNRSDRLNNINPPARIVRSQTEPINFANMVQRGDSTPAPKGLALPVDNHFNTPQAVLLQTEWEWEKSVGADDVLMRLLLEKLERDKNTRPQDDEQVQKCHEMTTNTTQGCDIFSARRGSGITPGGSFVDCLSSMSPSSDDSRIESLASNNRPSLGFNEPLPGRPPLSTLTQTAKNLARTLTRGRSMNNFNPSNGANNKVLIDTQSPLHPSLGGASSSSDDMMGAFAAEVALATVTDRMRKNKLKKARTKQRRMSIAFKSVQNAANRSSLLNNSSMDLSTDATAGLNTSRDVVYSPGVKSKAVTSTRSRRKSMMNSLSMSRMEPMQGGIEESQSCLIVGMENLHATDDNDDENDGFVVVGSSLLKAPAPDDCNESTFKGVVIGGHYQHCFDEGAPLVSAAGSEDNRVVDLQLNSAGNLTLQVYLPEKKACHWVDLGTRWTCIRASPTGYLVYKNDEEEDTGMSQDSWAIGDVIHEPIRMYFYLSKEPADWMRSPLNKSANSRGGVAGGTRGAAAAGSRGAQTRMSNVSGPFGSHDPAHFFRMIEPGPSLVSSAIFNAHLQGANGAGTGAGGAAGVGLRTNELRRGISLQEEFNSRDSLTASDDEGMDVCCFNQLERPDAEVVFDPDNLPESSEVTIRNAAASSVWSNAWLMSLVFTYLVDANRTSSPSSGGGRSPRGSAASGPAARRRLAAALRSVCKTWALAGYMLIARDLSDIDSPSSGSGVLKYDKWSLFAKKYNWGKFLSQGACKNVYCIVNPSAGGRLEAVSVMDIDDLRDREMTLAVTQELEISMLCSTLTQLNVCPNLVQVHSMFQSEYGAPEAVWNGREMRHQTVSVPTKKSLGPPGSHQFIRMEFCSGGDVEERVRKLKLLPVESVRSHLFQMCFALYACREQISLRHFDIKLLNFFVTSGASLLAHPESYTRGTIDVHYGFGKQLFRLQVSATEPQLVKLADFGTSAVGKQALGDPITLQQFTTLENTPIEYFLLGSQARQCYAADTFSLGLCVVHLLTGYEPYEELLKEVRCPKYLLTRLQKIWMTQDESSPYFLIRECIESIQAAEAEEEQEESSEGGTTGDEDTVGTSSGLNVLYDTLYRYLVLFGAPKDYCGAAYIDNPVWSLLMECLELAPSGKRKAVKARTECVAQFHRDYETWSIETGSNRIMQQARDRMSGMPGMSELLRSMTHFDPSKRCSMYEALHSPLFESLKIQHLSASQLASAHGGSASFMHYFRGGTAKDGSRVSNSDVVLDNLPIL